MSDSANRTKRKGGKKKKRKEMGEKDRRAD